MPGMPDTARIPPWLKAKKKYDKRRATRPVRWQMIAPSAMERRSVWSRADEARFDSPQFQAQLLRAFAAKQPRAGGSTGATSLPTPASPAEASSVFSKDVLQNFDILTKSAKVSYDEIARATLTGDMASLSHIKSIKGLLASLQKINEEEELALRERQGQGAPLQPPELFYLQLVDEGHLSERLRCLLFHFTRAEVLDQARKEQEVVLAALSAVVSSQGLTQLTQLLLFILNFLNEGPTSSPAYGFNLCDIDKVSRGGGGG
ncbi:protein diaphanous-like [Lethenteron reissneri]|uniref:protein diaphanous-like n=1 Tax=Lethenteron reissneri TaxID=7753 RepID=UPI002AB7CFB8|nr:protein diaphanous-like [Lethenteron reissneri]